ncbi:MAG: histidinol-phosphate transaminase [Ruminococcaceae bacterium]|nr:histidinol-phosphate transaminase [Oscillospiraceae bacterium]
MAYELNKKIRDLTPYEPINGSYKIRLDANESFITPSEEMRAKIEKAVMEVSFNRYPDPNATELCQAFADSYSVKPGLVTAGNGSDELISVIMTSFLQKGDKVLTLAPDFSMYAFYAELAEGEILKLPKNPDFTIDIDGVISKVKAEDVKIVIFSNPCNPTSKVIKKEEVRKLIESVDALVVLDEAYMDFSTESLLAEVEEYDNLIILRTCSKAVGMAAIRLGFAIANEKLTRVLKAVKSPYNVNSVTQAIGEAILSDKEYLKAGIARINASRDELFSELKLVEKANPDEIEIIAAEANFVYLKSEKAVKIFEYLMENSVVVRCFGEYLRITAGRNYENAEVIRLIKKYFKEQK